MEELDNICDDVHATTDRIREIVVVVVMRSLAKSLKLLLYEPQMLHAQATVALIEIDVIARPP